jgi:hypothetical protein
LITAVFTKDIVRHKREALYRDHDRWLWHASFETLGAHLPKHLRVASATSPVSCKRRGLTDATVAVRQSHGSPSLHPV